MMATDESGMQKLLTLVKDKIAATGFPVACVLFFIQWVVPGFRVMDFILDMMVLAIVYGMAYLKK